MLLRSIVRLVLTLLPLAAVIAPAQAQTPPPGPYLQTCSSAAVVRVKGKPLLSAACKFGTSGDTRGNQFNWSHCGKNPIVNRDGYLACGPVKKGLPSNASSGQGLITGGNGGTVTIQGLGNCSSQIITVPSKFNLHTFHVNELVDYSYTKSSGTKQITYYLVTMTPMKLGKTL